MEKRDVLNALKELEKSKKRNFKQTYELIINFHHFDVRKPESLIDLKVTLPHLTGKEQAKCLLFAKTVPFVEKVKDMFDKIIMESDIPNLTKKDIQEILKYDVLLAEGPVMLTVGKYLGQTLAPKGKMPKPVQADKDAVAKMIAGLKTAMPITNKRGKVLPYVQVVVGKEGMPLEDIADNILSVFNEVVNALPAKRHNIKSVYVKKTMSPAIRII